MKKLIVFCIFLFSLNGMYAQNNPEKQFDFWIGKWNLTWLGANGKIERGQNTISEILDGKVIQENFEATEGAQKGYKGISISVYNANSKTWHQTWMDNQRGNINFTGFFDENIKGFITRPQEVNGKQQVSRMVFKDITKDSFVWDWESSEDGGKTWKLNWQINYKRAQ
ncbi:hypothetical protein [uncultured Roseivirga sp.]|uniref:hypothetical protein n=1 Tax=uncultured Roseivirga sp. TaxID=543088 RepID=UPI0030DB1A3B|tara:strand:- start:279502 stop:280005 length:504 start_codon:yes stop_codon:yes gene_type:complete